MGLLEEYFSVLVLNRRTAGLPFGGLEWIRNA
jgi:hypothetical protein